MESNEKKRILGLDTGTNSIGWAVIDRLGDQCSLVDSGVHIFTEGVKEEQGKEVSKAAERTSYRAMRRGFYRRKLRKIRLLRILSELGWCPALSPELLSQWRLKKSIRLRQSLCSGWEPMTTTRLHLIDIELYACTKNWI